MNSKWSLFSFSVLDYMGIVDWPIFVDYLFLTRVQVTLTKNTKLPQAILKKMPNMDPKLCKQRKLLGKELHKVKTKQEMPFKIPSNI